MPLNDDAATRIDFYCNNTDGHSSVKPLLDADLVPRDKYTGDSLPAFRHSDHISERLAWRKYYQRDKVFTADRKWAFLLRPVYDFEGGKDLKANRTLYNTTLGAVLDADYKQKIGVELRFAGGMSVLPNYLDSMAHFSGTMPGWSDRAYPGGNAQYAFQHFSGNLIWRPSKVFNLQVGRDKHFWGDGYRSLFLSDLSAAYPYLQQQTTIWKLQYTSMFAWLQDWTNSNYAAKNFRSKFATFHYLSFNAAKWLNLGVFESVVWQGADENRYRAFDPNYLDPVVFFRPVEYSLGSSDNALLGFAFKVRFNKNNILYSQLILDEFYLKEIKNWSAGWWANKQGVQIGYKCYNFCGVERFFMQAELNIVRPYTYTHGSPQQNYANGFLPLAHPLGANFSELVGILSYSVKGFTVTGELVGARYGLDPAGKDYGQDIFISYIDRTKIDGEHTADYGHKLWDGIATNMFYAEFKASYRFNTAFPLRVELIAGARSESNVNVTKKSSYVMAGLSLPLFRTYRDY
ncbi:MAG TPA: hypothetical protein VFU15_11945 [Bacteroidia bacterium]|nr:hypothetical protein [Bacteroidia bacterium]